jgi:TetR/AcrR family transcriptional regulator, transcriptional repressor for nem operon
MIEVFAANLAESRKLESALAAVALCVGAMVVARAVDDPKLGDGFRDAARERVLANTGRRDPLSASRS